jgi:hypothetical protein
MISDNAQIVARWWLAVMAGKTRDQDGRLGSQGLSNRKKKSCTHTDKPSLFQEIWTGGFISSSASGHVLSRSRGAGLASIWALGGRREARCCMRRADMPVPAGWRGRGITADEGPTGQQERPGLMGPLSVVEMKFLLRSALALWHCSFEASTFRRCRGGLGHGGKADGCGPMTRRQGHTCVQTSCSLLVPPPPAPTHGIQHRDANNAANDRELSQPRLADLAASNERFQSRSSPATPLPMWCRNPPGHRSSSTRSS